MELVGPPKCRQIYQSTRRHMPVYFKLNSFAVRISLISHVYFIVIFVLGSTFQLRVQIQEVFWLITQVVGYLMLGISPCNTSYSRGKHGRYLNPGRDAPCSRDMHGPKFDIYTRPEEHSTPS